MDIHSLPQPDPSWHESAQQAVQQLIALSVLQSEQMTLQSEQMTLQSEQMTLQSEQIEKQAARIVVSVHVPKSSLPKLRAQGSVAKPKNFRS